MVSHNNHGSLEKYHGFPRNTMVSGKDHGFFHKNTMVFWRARQKLLMGSPQVQWSFCRNTIVFHGMQWFCLITYCSMQSSDGIVKPSGHSRESQKEYIPYLRSIARLTKEESLFLSATCKAARRAHWKAQVWPTITIEIPIVVPKRP